MLGTGCNTEQHLRIMGLKTGNGLHAQMQTVCVKDLNWSYTAKSISTATVSQTRCEKRRKQREGLKEERVSFIDTLKLKISHMNEPETSSSDWAQVRFPLIYVPHPFNLCVCLADRLHALCIMVTNPSPTFPQNKSKEQKTNFLWTMWIRWMKW